ncbi:hypothetical protein [Stenotrophomonas lacuserhaii]|uniref:hypothetical protein n=1 Tax=Stenotrophomonas lacuserhaii TaxID=2760084 RepID=UPI0032EFA094
MNAQIDTTDPWRGLYLAERLSPRCDYGQLIHPDLPTWPDDREEPLDKLVLAQGFDFVTVAGDFTDEALEDGDELYWKEMRAWNPEAPEGDWRLAWMGDTEDGPYAWFVRPMALRPEVVDFQAGVADWARKCFERPLYHNMTERGDRLLEEVLELLQSKGYDSARVRTLVDYVYGRPIGEPAQEVGGVMVTLAAYCSVAGLSMMADGQAELDRINQPDVMARIRAKQEAKNALHFDTPLPAGAGAAAEEWPLEGDLVRYGDGSSALAIRLGPHAGGWHGYQCCGGYIFFTKAYKPTRADMATWLDCAKYRDERTKIADNRVAHEIYLIDNKAVGNG